MHNNNWLNSKCNITFQTVNTELWDSFEYLSYKTKFHQMVNHPVFHGVLDIDGRKHLFSNPKLELTNLTYNDVGDFCAAGNATLFSYFSEEELLLTMFAMEKLGRRGAPIVLFSGFHRSQVR